MKQGWNEFFKILDDERDLLAQLVDLLVRERALITILDSEGLVENAKSKENLALKIKLVEEGRMALLRRLTPELGIKPEGANLSTLIQAAPAEVGQRLSEYREVFNVLIDRMAGHVRANGMLLQSSLALVNSLQNELSRLLGQRVTYEAEGRYCAEGGSARLSGRI